MNPPSTVLPPMPGSKPKAPQANTAPEPREPQAAQQPAPEPLPGPPSEPARPSAGPLPWQPYGLDVHTGRPDDRTGWQARLRLISRDVPHQYARPVDRNSELLATPIRNGLRELAASLPAAAKMKRLQAQLAEAQQLESEARAELSKLEEDKAKLLDAGEKGLATKLRDLDGKISKLQQKRNAAAADVEILSPLVSSTRQQTLEQLQQQAEHVSTNVYAGLREQHRVQLDRIIALAGDALWELAAIEDVIRHFHANSREAIKQGIAEAI